MKFFCRTLHEKFSSTHRTLPEIREQINRTLHEIF